MRRIRTVGLCLAAVFALCAVAAAAASAANPAWYIEKKATSKVPASVEVAKATTKIAFSGKGGESQLIGGLNITCSNDEVKGDTIGEKGVGKVKIKYKGCHETGNEVNCGGTKKEIKTESVKGTLTTASEKSGGATTVVERLEPEAESGAKAIFTKFKCGAVKHEFPVEVKGKIFVRVSPTYPGTPTLTDLALTGETFTEVKSAIAGCGVQKYLYENGAGACEFLKVIENGSELEPSANTSNDKLTFKSKIAIGS
jgi:opacity protein-like surface antigen